MIIPKNYTFRQIKKNKKDLLLALERILDRLRRLYLNGFLVINGLLHLLVPWHTDKPV